MKLIEYRLQQKITDDIIEKRFSCFNEVLHYYKDLESSKEVYDNDSSHLCFYIDGVFAGYTRLTECPRNYMALEKLEPIDISNDITTIEMGRTFVLPEFREIKLLNVILAIGLNICRQIGYKKVVGNVSYEKHIKMPSTVGFEFTNLIANFKMPFSTKGQHSFYLLVCDLEKTNQIRQNELARLKALMYDIGYLLPVY